MIYRNIYSYSHSNICMYVVKILYSCGMAMYYIAVHGSSTVLFRIVLYRYVTTYIFPLFFLLCIQFLKASGPI